MGVDTSGGGQAEVNGGENDSDEVEDIPRQPIEPRRSGRIRVPAKERWRTFGPVSIYLGQTRSQNPTNTWYGCWLPWQEARTTRASMNL